MAPGTLGSLLLIKVSTLVKFAVKPNLHDCGETGNINEGNTDHEMED